MKINITEQKLLNLSFIMGKELDREAILKDKSVIVTAEPVTKTRIITTLYHQDASSHINIEVEGFKLHKEETINYLRGGKRTSYYFVASKKQDKAAYLVYLEKLLEKVCKEYLMIEPDELNVILDDSFFNR